MHSYMNFSKTIKKNDPKNLDDGPWSPSAMVVWKDCLGRFGSIQAKLDVDFSDDDRIWIAKRIWGETEYLNLLDEGNGNRERNWVDERLK